MTDRMIQVCSVCGHPHIRARKRTGDWYCDHCHSALEKPVERPSMWLARAPDIPCPYCGSTRTQIAAAKSEKPYFRCIDCIQTFSITQERPMPPAGMLWACPVCGSALGRWVRNEWHCHACHAASPDAIIRKRHTHLGKSQRAPRNRFLIPEELREIRNDFPKFLRMRAT